MQVTTATSEALGKYLDLTSAQMRLTATNMANVDTPGYKTQGFDFGQEFSRALNTDGYSFTSPDVEETDGLIARPDGNNVSMDREGVDLAKAQLQFKLGVSLLRSQYSQVMSAIHGDSK
jgi:flagellar basal-body rod protein FlgB